MRSFIFLIIFGISFLAQAECLVSFNVYGPIYASAVNSRTKKIAQEIKSRHLCKLVHLQEAWNDSQIDILERDLRQEFQIYAPNRTYRIGLMLLARRAWAEARTFSFNVNYDDGFLDQFRRWVNAQKAFSFVKNVLPDTLAVNTHLHPSSEAIRIMQIMDIFNWRVLHKNQALVLSGDFNSAPNSLEHRLVRALLDVDDSYQAAHGEYPKDFCTYCEDNPMSWLSGNHVLDYVFLSKARPQRPGWKAVKNELVLTGQESPLSDHYGVKAHFEKIGPSESPKKTRQDILNILSEAQAKLLISDHRQSSHYLQLMQRIESEIIAGVGIYADYFAEMIL